MERSDAIELFSKLSSQLGIEANLKVVSSSNPNAWTDGSTVWATTSLLESLNDSEIAAVLGHELGHIALRHLPTTQNELEALRSRLHSQESLKGIERLVAAAVIEVGLAVATQVRRRRHELQADRIGEAVARSTGSGKGNMASALESIAPNHQDTGLFDSHPSTPVRVESLETSPGRRLKIRIVRTRD